jgi:glycosyltransferase involved in cell wall biosynthesis
LFVGSRSDANLVGIVWFLELVLPLIRTALPDVRLRIHGSIVSSLQQVAPQFLESEAMILTGTAADMDEVYASAKVVICPVRHGTGMKIKMVEAMAYGKAIVATSKAAEGISADFGLECFDAPEAFAAACVTLLADERARLRNQGHARATFARDHQHRRLGEGLAGLLKQLGVV